MEEDALKPELQNQQIDFDETKSSLNSPRKSVREKRRRQSFSPDPLRSSGKRSKSINRNSSPVKKQISTSKDTHTMGTLQLGVKQPPFSCGLCKSPYVSDPMKSKRGCRTKKSRHNPSPKVHFDPATGNRIEICNACASLLNPVRVPEPRPQLSANEKQTMVSEAKQFAFRLALDLNNSDAERLYCAHFKSTTICGCLQAYLLEDRDRKARELLSMMEEARNLSRLKSYLPTQEKKQRVGLGNGQKRAKEFEDYILEKRNFIRQDIKLCETACKQVLLYSNNFLHKHIKTESRRRMKRTKCKGKLNILPEIYILPYKTCCIDMCVQMALSHFYLLSEWRNRAQTCQAEARRVLAEMLTPSGGSAKNCYKFIHWVTGCSNGTIQKVNRQMKATRGNREPPRHGLRKNWEVENHIGGQQEQDTDLNVQSSENTENYIIVPVSAPSSTVPSDSHGGQLYNIQKQILDQFVSIQQQQKQVSQQIMQKSTPQNNQEATNVQYLMDQVSTLQQTVEQFVLPKGHGVMDNQPIANQHLHSNQGQDQQMVSNSQYYASSISSSPRVSASSSPNISIGQTDRVSDQSAPTRQISLLTGKVVEKQPHFHPIPQTTETSKRPQKSVRLNQRGTTHQPSATITVPVHEESSSVNALENPIFEPINTVTSHTQIIDTQKVATNQKSTKRRHKSHPAPSNRVEPVAQRSASTSVEMMSQPIIQVPVTNQISVVNQIPQIPLSNAVPAFVGEDGILNFFTPMPVAYNIQAYQPVTQKITNASGGIQILQPINNQVSSQNGGNDQSFIITPSTANQIVTMPTQSGQQTVIYQLPPGFQGISIPQGQQISESQPQQFQIIQPELIQGQGQQQIQVQGQQQIQVQTVQPQQVQEQMQGQQLIQFQGQQIQVQGQPVQIQGQQQIQVQGQVKQHINHITHQPQVTSSQNCDNAGHQMEVQGHIEDHNPDHHHEHQIIMQHEHPQSPNHHVVLNPQISENRHQSQMKLINDKEMPLSDHFHMVEKPDFPRHQSMRGCGDFSDDSNLGPELQHLNSSHQQSHSQTTKRSITTEKIGSKSRRPTASVDVHPQDPKDDNDSAVLKEMTTDEIMKANAAVSDALVGCSRSIRVTTTSGRELFDAPNPPATETLSHDLNLGQSNVKKSTSKQPKAKPTKKAVKRKYKAKPKTPKKKLLAQKMSVLPNMDSTNIHINEFEAASEIPNTTLADVTSVPISRVKVTAEQPLKIRHKSGNKTFAPSFDLDPNLNMTSSNHVYSSSHNVPSTMTSSSNSAPPSRSSLANTPTSQLLANPNLPLFMSSPDYEHALSIMNSDPDLTNMRNWNYSGEITPLDPLSLSSSDILQILSSHHDPKPS